MTAPVLPPAAPLFLLGQTLHPGEPPATGALRLARPYRRALTLCLDGERLDDARRLGWRHPRSAHARIGHGVIRTLAARGLMTVVARGRFARHVRLTPTGDWYARTLVSHAIAHCTRASRANPETPRHADSIQPPLV